MYVLTKYNGLYINTLKILRIIKTKKNANKIINKCNHYYKDINRNLNS